MILVAIPVVTPAAIPVVILAAIPVVTPAAIPVVTLEVIPAVILVMIPETTRTTTAVNPREILAALKGKDSSRWGLVDGMAVD